MRAPEPQEEPFPFTSLIDIGFLLIIFFMSLPLRQLDGKLEAHLPREGVLPSYEPEVQSVRISVRLREGALVYGIGDRTAPTPAGLGTVLRALGPHCTYEIDASAAVPWSGVVDVVDVLKGAGCTRVRFRAAPPPALPRGAG